MTDKHIKQIESQLPAGEKIERMYKAFEGDIRVITKDRDGCEIRYPRSDGIIRFHSLKGKKGKLFC